MTEPIYVPGGLTVPRPPPPPRDPPIVLSITPDRGDSAGGTSAQITGRNLRKARAVFIGGDAAEIIATTETTIDIVTRAHGIGSDLDVVVVTSGGAGTLEDAFSTDFSPTNITGLQWWLRADRGTTLTEVTGWDDQSGAGDANRNFVRENVNGPTFVASDPAFGDKPTLDFSSGNLSMVGAWSDAPVGQPFTIIIVGKDDALDAGHRPWIGDADVNEWYMATCPLTPDLTGPPHFISSASTPSPDDTELQSTTIDTGQPVVWMYEFSDPNSSTMRINSQATEVLIQRGGSGSADSGIAELGRLAIGWAFGTGVGLVGKIAEIIIVDGILGDAQRSSLLSYLGGRYAISVTGSPGAPIDDPSALPGLRLWLRADKGVTARVSHWADQSVAGDANRDAANATLNTQPRRVQTDPDFNDQPTLHLNSEFLDVVGLWSNAPVSQPYTLVVVGSDSVAGVENFLGAKSANAWYVTSEGGVYKSDVVTTLSGTTPDTTSPKILFFEYADPSSTIRVNAATPDVTGATNAPALPELEIGGNQQGQRPLTGVIAEVIAYRGVLSSQDRTSLLSYLGNRYGITVGP